MTKPGGVPRTGGGSEHLYLVLVAVGCGLAGAAGAIVFRGLIQFFGTLFLGASPGLFGPASDALRIALDPRHPEALAPGADLAWWRRLLAPALGGAIVGPLVHYLAREAKGHGVPEVMEAVALRGGVIRSRVVVIKALASALTIGSGGSVGREGPIVQIGAAVGSTIGQVLRLPARHLRTLVGCGAAAGIAAIFNAPIAGALFAVEIILADFAAAQFAPIVIASVVATVVSRAVLGDSPAFVVPGYQLVSGWELIAYAGCGVLAGLVGVAFTTLLYAAEDGFDRLPAPAALKPMLGGLLVGLIGIEIPRILGAGYATLQASLEGQLALAGLALLLVAKLAATSLTLASGGSGGIFTPSLFLGAATGGLFGTLVHDAFPAWTAASGAYALVTMGALVAATTHAPITAIIMIFEMTKSIAIIPPLMVACVISTVVAAHLRRESIYTAKLLRRGVDLLAEKETNVLKSLRVRDVIDREPELIPAHASLREILDLVVRSRHDEFFVVDEQQNLLGTVSVPGLRRLLFDHETLSAVVVAADLAEPRPTVTEDDDLDTVLHLLSNAGAAELAVLDGAAGRRVVGAVLERDVLAAYHGETLRRDLAGGFASRVGVARRSREVPLGGGYLLADLPVPPSLVGKSLSELDVRARTGIQVLLVRSRVDGEDAIRVPTPDDRLGPEDRVVVAGRAESVQRLGRGLT